MSKWYKWKFWEKYCLCLLLFLQQYLFPINVTGLESTGHEQIIVEKEPSGAFDRFPVWLVSSIKAMRKHDDWQTTQIRADTKMNLRHNLRPATQKLCVFLKWLIQVWHSLWGKCSKWKDKVELWLTSDKHEKITKHHLTLNISPGDS